MRELVQHDRLDVARGRRVVAGEARAVPDVAPERVAAIPHARRHEREAGFVLGRHIPPCLQIGRVGHVEEDRHLLRRRAHAEVLHVFVDRAIEQRHQALAEGAVARRHHDVDVSPRPGHRGVDGERADRARLADEPAALAAHAPVDHSRR